MSQMIEMVEKRVPLFYGQVDVDPNDVHFFIDACKKIERMFAGKPDQLELLLEEVMFRLRGRAYTLLKDHAVKNLQEFYSVLSRKFLPAFTVESLQNRLREARQTKAESCTEFGSRVQSYALDYEAGVRTKYGEGNALPKPLVASMEQEAFVRGLNNQVIRMQLSVATEKTIKELVEMADRMERQLGYSPSTTRETNSQESSQVKCQLCDRGGHSAKTCRQNLQYHTQKASRIPPVVCKYCKRIGHVLENCAARTAANRRYLSYQSQPHPFNQNFGPSFPNQGQQKFQHSPQDQLNRNSPKKQYQPTVRSPNNQNYPNRNQQGLNNQNINQLTNNLRRMNINYVEEVDEDSIYQGNEEGLVEHQQQ